MASVSFTNFANVINKFIAKDIKIQTYSMAPTWLLFGGWDGMTKTIGEQFNSRTRTDEISWVNNTLYFDVQSGSLTAYSIPTGDNLQNSTLTFPQGSLSLTTATNSFNIPKQLMNLTRGAGAIAGTLQKYSENMATGLGIDLNRQCVMDGTGNLAYYGISSSNSGTAGTYTAITNSGAQYFWINASPNGDLDVSRYFSPGVTFQLNNGSATTNLTVTSVTSSGGLVKVTCGAGSASTFTPSSTTTAIKLSGSNNPVIEMTGLMAIVGNSTYAGIDPSTDGYWQSTVDTNGGATKALAYGDVNKVYNAITGKGFGRPDVILSNVTEYTAAQNLAYNQLRFTTRDTFYGGSGGMEWGGGSATWFLEPDLPDDTILVLNTKDLWKGEYQALETEPGTKGSALRVPGSLNYEVVSDWMGQIGSDRRASQGILTNRVG